MKRSTQWIIIAVIVIVLASYATFLKMDSDSIDKQKNTIQIGAVLPLGGISAIYGQYPREGMDLAVDEINAAGGINGKNLEIIYEDSQSQPTNAVTSLQKIIGSSDVPAVISGASSPETLAQAPVAEKNKVVLLAAGSAAPNIRFAGDYIFRVKVSVNKEVETLMDFAYTDLEARSIYILYVQNDYGEGVNKFTNDVFLEMGGRVLGREGFDIEETDFRTFLEKSRAANPDVVVLAGWPRNMGQILKQAKEMGINTTFITPGGTIGPEIIEIAGDAADGLIYTMEFDLESSREATKDFMDRFRKKYRKDPELFSALGYDAVKIISAVMKDCGENSECIKDGLYRVENYDGASGVISFDEFGDVEKPLIFMTIKNGEFVRVD